MMVKQFQLERKTDVDIMDGEHSFCESHEEFVNSVTAAINSITDMKKLISVNYVVLGTKHDDKEIAVVTYATKSPQKK